VTIMLRAAIAVFSLGIGSAYAGDGDGYSATTLFTAIQSEEATVARTAAAQNDRAAVQTYDTRAQGLGTWLLRVFALP
jgi:hypothetical protein